jgi:hypothetical protein
MIFIFGSNRQYLLDQFWIRLEKLIEHILLIISTFSMSASGMISTSTSCSMAIVSIDVVELYDNFLRVIVCVSASQRWLGVMEQQNR